MFHVKHSNDRLSSINSGRVHVDNILSKIFPLYCFFAPIALYLNVILAIIPTWQEKTATPSNLMQF